MDSIIEEVKEPSSTDRFKNAIWLPDTLKQVSIIGLGNIGSWAALYLSRIGYELDLVDPDRVSIENLGGQLYSVNSVFSFKVIETKDILRALSTSKKDVAFSLRKIEETGLTGDIIFCCVDNLDVRKHIFKRFLTETRAVIFIDGRANAQNNMVFGISKFSGNFEKYSQEYLEKHLPEDKSIPEESCNFKSTTHCGAITAGYMVSLLNNLISNYTMYKGNYGEQDIIYPEPFSVRCDLFNLTLEHDEVKVRV
jgi:molybdopterin/thiamine biosynthesis adenylyltransferase